MRLFAYWLLNFRLRFAYEIVCFLLHNFLTRFPNEISCFLAVMRCPYEILSSFAAYFPYEISCFLAIMRCPCEILCFLLRNLRRVFPLVGGEWKLGGGGWFKCECVEGFVWK